MCDLYIVGFFDSRPYTNPTIAVLSPALEPLEPILSHYNRSHFIAYSEKIKDNSENNSEMGFLKILSALFTMLYEDWAIQDSNL